MTKRDPIIVVLLSFVTFGIYYWYWMVKTKGELNAANHDDPKIPTAWVWLIPIVGTIWWTWKFSEGVQKKTNGACSSAIAFILLWLLSAIGGAIVQNYLNESNRAKA